MLEGRNAECREVEQMKKRGARLEEDCLSVVRTEDPLVGVESADDSRGIDSVRLNGQSRFLKRMVIVPPVFLPLERYRTEKLD
jgi:hypothetical protein